MEGFFLGPIRTDSPLSARSLWIGIQFSICGVLGGGGGGESVLREDKVQSPLVVAQQRLLLLLRPVLQRVWVHLLYVSLDSADLQCSERGSAHDADEPVSPGVVVHQVLHPPADLVVSPLVLPGIVAVTRGWAHLSAFTLLFLHHLCGCCDVKANVLT